MVSTSTTTASPTALPQIQELLRRIADEIRSELAPVADAASDLRQATSDLDAFIEQLNALKLSDSLRQKLEEELVKFRNYIDQELEGLSSDLTDSIREQFASVEETLRSDEHARACLELIERLRSAPENESKAPPPGEIRGDLRKELQPFSDAVEGLSDAGSKHKQAAAELMQAAASIRQAVGGALAGPGDIITGGSATDVLSGGPTPDILEFTEGLRSAREASQELRLVAGDALDDIEDIGLRVFSRLEGAIQQFATTGKVEWQGLARAAIQSIQDILLAQIEAARASSSFGGGILGDIFGSVFGLFGGGTQAGTPGGGGVPLDPFLNPFVGHTGGIVGGDPLPRRIVGGVVFDGAARFAAGGVAGLAPDEVPAILHGGEGVFTPAQMRALGGGGQAPAQPVAEFQVNVINNTGEQTKVQQRRTPGGGRQIDVIVGELAAKDVLRGGPLHRAIRLAFAVNPMTVTR